MNDSTSGAGLSSVWGDPDSVKLQLTERAAQARLAVGIFRSPSEFVRQLQLGWVRVASEADQLSGARPRRCDACTGPARRYYSSAHLHGLP